MSKTTTFIFVFLITLIIGPFAYGEEGNTETKKIVGYVVSNYTKENKNAAYEIDIIKAKEDKILPIYAGLSFNMDHFSLVFNGYPFAFSNYNLQMTKEYGVALAAEGPHIELIDWKTCDGKTRMLGKNGNTYTYEHELFEEDSPCDIDFEVEDLRGPISDIFTGDETNINRWMSVAEQCKEQADGCINAIAYRFEVISKDKKLAMKPFKIILPNGC